MRKIQKTYSLEPMTSRMPSVLPAYKDNNPLPFFFDDESLKKREYQYPSNYGMIPMKISFSSSTNNNTIEYGFDCSSAATTISFERLSNWYHFFKEYYHLLNDYGHCDRTYSSATQYYEYESGERYADQMLYGTNEQTYKDLDDEFHSMGGQVDVANIISGASDVGFYKWICDNIVPTYYILNDYTEYWKRKKLYYPDVIKWIAWFRNRQNYENEANYSAATKNEIEHWTCRGISGDCCDCEDYFKRGGARTLSSMTDWYNSIQKNISNMNEVISANTECFIPTMDDKIQLHNSLDDLGQYSIFSKEYELGIDYRTASYGDTENTHSGTTAEISGDTMILTNGSGFCYSPYYMEKIYDKDAWGNYTDMYMKENQNEFVSSAYSFYAFDDDGKIYTGNNSGDVKNAMTSAYTYDIISADTILIDGALYQIEQSEYGSGDTTNQYLSGKTFFVYREKDTSTPYTLINGKKVYAEWYPFGDNPCYYFTFFKSENVNKRSGQCNNVDNSFNINNYKQFGRRRSTASGDVIDYISYYGRIFQVSGNSITIDNIERPRVTGYAYSDSNELMYCISGKVVDSETLLEIPSSSAIGNTIVIGLTYEPTIYKAKEVTGRTISKLTDLEATDVLMDDIGNKIDGKYIFNGAANERPYNHQPPQGAELDLLYEVGNVSNIRRFKLTAEEPSDVVNNTNYFVGNIITDMVFYYKDVDGNKVTETEKNWNEFSSSLSAITASTSVKDSMSATTIFDGDDIYCDVTYYIGATLGRESGGTFFLAYAEDTHYNYGVEYKETVNFVKENREYYLKKEIKKQIPSKINAVSAHSVSYPIYVYKLKQDLKEVEGDVYNTYFQSPLATFKTEINLINTDLTTIYSGYTDMPTYNNIHVSPTFKQEYMLGISSLENVDSDIYIERGINAAFEKHLKLGEITSMEALEQYSNGYFKIMNN